MKVVLVRPNAGLKSTYLPLGLGYIAGAARSAGHDVTILDARLERLPVTRTVRRILDERPDVIGLTALYARAEKEAALDVAGVYKREGGKAPVVLGGALVSSLGREMVATGLIDLAVAGEGEAGFTGYLKALEAGQAPDRIPGVIFSRDGVVQAVPRDGFIEDINQLNVAWDLLRPERYFSFPGRSGQSVIKKSHRCLPLFTSRGCPFGCIYCHNVFGRKFRARSPESVVREMAMLKDTYGVREIEIEDDCFNADPDRAKAIARRMIDEKLDLALSFPTGLRADRMDRELIDLLKQAGTYRIIYAVETAVPRLQRLIRKNLDFQRTDEMIAYTADRGIMTGGFFMQGFPTETETEMRRTVDYALGSKLHQAFFFYVNPFPGTELAERFPVKEAQNDGNGHMRYSVLRVNLSEVPSATLWKINKSAYRRFHFSIRRMWRTLRVAPKNLRTLWAVLVTLALSFRDLEDF
ncbi:MAG: radical SAM protein [Thermodesulfobacteriota bacterium]